MSSRFRPADRLVSDVLSEMARTVPAEGLTLHDLLERLGTHGLRLLCMVLTIPLLLPVSIPGSSVSFGLVIALTGVGIVTHRPPWLPDRLMNRQLAADHLVPVLQKGARLLARVEQLTLPRLFPRTPGAT
jgi:hypothetical protein